jgi:hypothetical protein
LASKAFPHVIVRDGWYHYHRRVPAAVRKKPDAWEAYFESKPHFRRSLFTNVYREALKAASDRAEEFERRVRSALSPPTPAIIQQRREFSAEVLAEIASTIREQLIVEWRAMIRRAKVDPDDDHYLTVRLDRIIDRADPSDQMTALLGVTPFEKARRLNEHYSFGLDEASDEFAEIILAVEDGCTAAREGIQELFGGRSLPSQSGSTLINQYSQKRETDSPTLRQVIERYLADKRVRPKTANEIKTSLELFEATVGDKRLDDLTRDDFISYIEMLAAKRVGGRTSGSIERAASKGTIQKRVGFLRTAINHAIQKNLHKGGNPAGGFNISAWTQAPDKTVMRDKRPFRPAELNKIFEHPWFTGCRSVEHPHLAVGGSSDALNAADFQGFWPPARSADC